MYDVVELGLNYRMSEMQARAGPRAAEEGPGDTIAPGGELHAAETRTGQRDDVVVLDAVPPAASGYYCLSAVLRGPAAARRDRIVARLNALGVGTSIYYRSLSHG